MENKFYTTGRKIIVTILTVFLFACGGSGESEQEGPEPYRGFDDFNIKRGINISHWLSQSQRRGIERDEYFTQSDVQLIASLGFDHIRLPIDEVQMWDDYGNKEPRAFELMHKAIGWALEENLPVIVDLHIIRSHHFNLPENPLWTDRNEQLKFVELWRQLSEELIKYPNNMVAYELMNEPVADDPELWNNLVAETIAAIRESEPERKLVIGSNRWQSVHTFKDLRIPENDRHIILSFHFYEPFLLTHHQASWTSIAPYNGPVNYPGLTVNPEDIPADLSENVIRDLNHHNQVYNREKINELVQMPLAFAKKYDLPLYCGEWGCLPTVPQEAMYQWYQDVRSVMEENEIAWTKWDYKGSFGILDRNTLEKQTELLEILLP
jgi:endoglucanase